MPGNKPWEQKPPGRRLAKTRERRRVLIVCEDSKSACDYFKSFKIDSNRAEVFPVGTGMDDLRMPPGNRLESPAGNRKGRHSIRVNDQWRICFEWRDGNAAEVEIVDYH